MPTASEIGAFVGCALAAAGVGYTSYTAYTVNKQARTAAERYGRSKFSARDMASRAGNTRAAVQAEAAADQPPAAQAEAAADQPPAAQAEAAADQPPADAAPEPDQPPADAAPEPVQPPADAAPEPVQTQAAASLRELYASSFDHLNGSAVPRASRPDGTAANGLLVPGHERTAQRQLEFARHQLQCFAASTDPSFIVRD